MKLLILIGLFAALLVCAEGQGNREGQGSTVVQGSTVLQGVTKDQDKISDSGLPKCRNPDEINKHWHCPPHDLNECYVPSKACSYTEECCQGTCYNECQPKQYYGSG